MKNLKTITQRSIKNRSDMSKQASNKVKIKIDLLNEGFQGPQEDEILHWLEPLFADPQIKISRNEVYISFSMITLNDMQQLNKQYRQKDKPTNVLSFPCTIPNAPHGFLGDIVLCAPQIEKEATEQAKELKAHWAHLVIHGTLHLLGYDHETEQDANIMENLEITLLEKLSFPNPYGELHE